MIDPLNGLRRIQQEQRTLGLRFSEPGGVLEGDGPRTYPFDQCRCGGIQHMGCCTPHLSCSWLVLGLWGAEAPASGPERTECDLDGKGGQDPTDEFGQSTDVGESHRSIGPLVTWSLPIRLWAGVLVYVIMCTIFA